MYRRLLAQPGAPALLTGSLLTRLPLAMAPLAMVLAVSAARSVALGGLAAAAYTVGAALLGPVRGRLVDRLGPRPVVLVGSLGQVAFLVGFLVALPSAWALAFAAGTGAVMPPVSPITRATWNRLLHHDEALMHAAQSGESVMIDLSYVVAPSIVAVVAAVTGPRAALVVTAVAAGIGGPVFAASRHLARPERLQRQGFSPFSIAAPIASNVLSIAAISAVEIASVRVAKHVHHPSAAGWLVALLSVGSIAGGLAYGSRRPPGSDRAHLAGVSALWAAGTLGCAALSTLVPIGVLLAVVGVGMGPAITAQYAIVGTVVPQRSRTEAYAWMTTASQGGSALGSAVAAATTVPFVVSAAFAAAVLVLLAVSARTPAAQGDPG